MGRVPGQYNLQESHRGTGKAAVILARRGQAGRMGADMMQILGRYTPWTEVL